MSQIFFDHTYTADLRHRFLKRLGRCGFHISEHEMRHPGGSHCRFIRFAQPRSARGTIYLEFVHTTGRHEPKKEPGLSFSTKSPLERLNTKLAKNTKYKINYFHRNYDWQKGEDERRPGWNFLKFERPKVRGIYPWFTEYERHLKQKKLKPIQPHPNGALFPVALEIEVDPTFEKILVDLTGKEMTPRLSLACGTQLRLTRAKKNRMRTAVVACADLKKFVRNYDFDRLETFDDQPAARIMNPNGMWDVLLIAAK